jgi:hypothetical protein
MHEQADFRQRLESRIAGQHADVISALVRIEAQVLQTNGRTRDAEAAVLGINRRLDRVDEDDNEIANAVQAIREGGCSKYGAHVEILRQNVEGWSPRKKAAVGGGLIAGGAVAWPAIQELARAIHALVDWLGRVT